LICLNILAIISERIHIFVPLSKYKIYHHDLCSGCRGLIFALHERISHTLNQNVYSLEPVVSRGTDPKCYFNKGDYSHVNSQLHLLLYFLWYYFLKQKCNLQQFLFVLLSRAVICRMEEFRKVQSLQRLCCCLKLKCHM